jgi:hypothetical protein
MTSWVVEKSFYFFQKSRKSDIALFEIQNYEETTNKSHRPS